MTVEAKQSTGQKTALETTAGEHAHATSWQEQLSASPWLLVALAGFCWLFWDAWLLVPLKILVVFFHESAHALATVLTGGSVIAMRIVPDQGGEVQSLGGIAWIIVSAGYLGSLLIGASILIIASRSRADRVWMVVLAVMMAALTVIFVRNGYGFGFGLAGAASMLLLAKFLPNWCNDLVLKLIGVLSMLYVPWDIFSDTLARSHLHSDARILAELIGGSTVIWGGLWLALSVPMTLFALWLSYRHAS